jgi:hypothetical protein
MSFMRYLDGHLWVAHTLSQCTSVKQGRVSSNSVLLSLLDPIIPYVPVHNQCLLLRAQPIQSSIDTGESYHLWSCEYENRPLSPFTSGILYFPLIVPLGLKLCHIPKIKVINHIEPPSIERALSPGSFQPLIFYR